MILIMIKKIQVENMKSMILVGQVLENIRLFCPEKTCIVTTHHASVLSLCTRIYRVQKTRVTELTREEASRIIMDC